jgi:sigma-B regulation protein RsbU (phosphoserine phosphatase)
MFVTVFLGILNINNGDFQYCNAAHNYPIKIHNEGRLEKLQTLMEFLGIYPNRKYSDTTIKLNSGDQIFIYTDGLTDTTDENGLKYTVDVLKYNLMGRGFLTQKVVEKINKSVINFRGNIKPGMI